MWLVQLLIVCTHWQLTNELSQNKSRIAVAAFSRPHPKANREDQMQSRIPTVAGMYYWDEWDKRVNVYERGNSLWVKVWPHWHAVKITPRIAGKFTKVD
ncbi:hypothetical protein [Xanthomonas phage XAJ2]|uniref:Uncharacterized protein n=1 Tax=Xanthomonas phage XAJ2 TaxID=1775249 RepID=A0A1I9L2L0_9CAUD|nr:hypothetical protein [Xanthomonas phage XAJ2]